MFARLDVGDRLYYWAAVIAASQTGPGRPLREQDFFAATNEEQKPRLIADRERDMLLQRPLAEKWRNALPDSLRWPR
jgi:hypothetical protein